MEKAGWDEGSKGRITPWTGKRRSVRLDHKKFEAKLVELEALDEVWTDVQKIILFNSYPAEAQARILLFRKIYREY